MNKLQIKLSNEYMELRYRLRKLNLALVTDGFREKVGDYQHKLLLEQKLAMEKYLKTLDYRLNDIGVIPEDLPHSFMDFGMALQELEDGKAVCRFHWAKESNRKWFLVKMKSTDAIGKKAVEAEDLLPSSAKEILSRRPLARCGYKDVLLLFDISGNCDSWSPTTEDILAHDWVANNTFKKQEKEE